MYKKMDEETLNGLLECGIRNFGEFGLDRANINIIAKEAGVSVGVIYKYYEDKERFFLECVRYSLKPLDALLTDVLSEALEPKEMIYRVIKALQLHAKEHGFHNVMYNEITSGSCRKYAGILSEEIERKTAEIYASFIGKYNCRSEIDSRFLAFFFDNLLMMLQFSYSCDYYKERMRIFVGEDNISDDDAMAQAMTEFIYRGFFK